MLNDPVCFFIKVEMRLDYPPNNLAKSICLFYSSATTVSKINYNEVNLLVMKLS